MSVPVTLKIAAVAATLVAGTFAGASAANADSSPTTPSSQAQLEAACYHVDQQLTRAGKLQTRLHADARTKGSLAFLQARIDRANFSGQTALAQVLSDRLVIRKQIDAQLPEVIQHLNAAKATCTSAGVSA